MRKWNARRKFRQGALGVIATNRMNKMMEGLSTAAKTIEQEKAVRCRIAVLRVPRECVFPRWHGRHLRRVSRVGRSLPSAATRVQLPPNVLFCAARSAAVNRGQAP
jgi:hypothetical protein